ncbi:MAG: DUF3256 family protein [Bacteroidales bacterium]|nr:DUF3256 family protein [Bacteroidales bacterium]
MRKIIYILFLMFAFAAQTNAQEMRTIFVEMPDSIIPLLTKSNRADCVDFLDAKMKARVTNRFDGHSELLQLTPDYLKMQLTGHTFLQMKLLPRSSGDTIICMINTVCAEACDSRIRFYTKKWQQITPAEKLLQKPMIKDFFTPGDPLEKILQIADIYLVELKLFPLVKTMQASYTMPAYMSRKDSAFVTKNMHLIEYQWTGKTFEQREK